MIEVILFSYLGTNLVTALAGLDVHDFPHCGCESCKATSRSVTLTAPEPQPSDWWPDNAFIMLESFQEKAGAGGVGVARPRPGCCAS